jgi:hypothetical protein
MLKDKQFFSEEKNQKTFMTLGLGRCLQHGPCPSKRSLFASFSSEKEGSR